jgi:hypothetical protein
LRQVRAGVGRPGVPWLVHAARGTGYNGMNLGVASGQLRGAAGDRDVLVGHGDEQAVAAAIGNAALGDVACLGKC